MLLKADELERLYLWEALFASHEYSELPSAAAEVLYLAPRSREFFLPRDRIGFMKFRVYETICSIPDPAVIPYMHRYSPRMTQLCSPKMVLAWITTWNEIRNLDVAARGTEVIDSWQLWCGSSVTDSTKGISLEARAGKVR
jgi:hypothetical protein